MAPQGSKSGNSTLPGINGIAGVADRLSTILNAVSRAALNDTSSVWAHGAMEAPGVLTFRDNMLLGSEENLPKVFSIETEQPVSVMRPLHFRQKWLAFR